MMAEMEELRAAKGAPSSSKSAYHTPPPKVAAPSPDRAPRPPSKPPKPPTGVTAASAEVVRPPETEGAKLARLRRLCELKPSGKCAVSTELHQRWKRGDKHEREAMVEEFEKAGWDKDFCFFVTVHPKSLFHTNIIEDSLWFQLFPHFHHPRNYSSAASPRR